MQSTKTCSFDGCDNPHKARGLCDGHYIQQHKGQELRPLRPSSQGLTFEQRFWAKVDKTDECWVWTSVVNSGGYGRIRADGRYRYAHRVSWEFINGPVPDCLELDHRCGNRACVNPAHLRPTTRSQNMQHRTISQRNNTSGVRGVCWDKKANAWRARAMLNGRTYSGGYHSTIESAAAAAQVLRNQLFTHDDYDEWEKGTL